MRREHCTLGQSEMPSSGTQPLSACSNTVPDEEGKIKNMTFKRLFFFALASMAQLVEHHPMQRKVIDSIPSQSTWPYCGLNPQ